MRPRNPVAKVLVVFVGLVVLCVAFVIWEFGFTHHLATLRLGEHKLCLTTDQYYDVAHPVLCELRGPKWQHSAEVMAYIGAGESCPEFTVHQAPNVQVFWVTADTMPKTIIYALDVATGEHWPPRKSGNNGQNFLEIANSAERGFRLYQHEWIGVKR